MTDALHDRALVMAREIYADHYFANDQFRATAVLAGKGDHALDLLVKCIIATTERAADHCLTMDGPLNNSGACSAALSRAAHLKDPS